MSCRSIPVYWVSMASAVVQATLPLVTLMTTGVLITVRVVPQSIPDGVAYAVGTADGVAAVLPEAPDVADEQPLVAASSAARHSSPVGRAVPIRRRTGRFVVTSGTFPVEFPSRAACPSLQNLRMSGHLP